MLRIIALSRRLLACARGSTLVGYSSLMLLFALAAITVLGRVNADGDGDVATPRARNDLSAE
jgi:hypothetical protein